MGLLTDPWPQHRQRSSHKHVPDICMPQRWASEQKESGPGVFWFQVNEGKDDKFCVNVTQLKVFGKRRSQLRRGLNEGFRGDKTNVETTREYLRRIENIKRKHIFAHDGSKVNANIFQS